jgi:hypothetical protein
VGFQQYAPSVDIGFMDTDVSEEHITSTFRAEDKLSFRKKMVYHGVSIDILKDKKIKEYKE